MFSFLATVVMTVTAIISVGEKNSKFELRREIVTTRKQSVSVYAYMRGVHI